MPATSYIYNVTADFPEGKVNIDRLIGEIGASSIITALDRIDTVGGSTSTDGVTSGGTIEIWFKSALSAADRTTLDGDTIGPAGGLIAAHDNSPSAKKPRKTADGVLLSQIQVQTVDWQMCDRDFKITTCTLVDSVEDLKVNLATLKEDAWDELALVNVYKDDGAGNNVPVTDQADADANGILSVWDYVAKDQSVDPKTPVAVELRDGGIIADPAIVGLASELYDHRAYAIGAPDLAALGVATRFFDGYLAAQPDGRVEAKSPQARRMDPDAAPGASVLRIYLYHPAGAKRTHVVRLVTYRPPGSF